MGVVRRRSRRRKGENWKLSGTIQQRLLTANGKSCTNLPIILLIDTAKFTIPPDTTYEEKMNRKWVPLVLCSNEMHRSNIYSSSAGSPLEAEIALALRHAVSETLSNIAK